MIIVDAVALAAFEHVELVCGDRETLAVDVDNPTGRVVLNFVKIENGHPADFVRGLHGTQQAASVPARIPVF